MSSSTDRPAARQPDTRHPAADRAAVGHPVADHHPAPGGGAADHHPAPGGGAADHHPAPGGGATDLHSAPGDVAPDGSHPARPGTGRRDAPATAPQARPSRRTDTPTGLATSPTRTSAAAAVGATDPSSPGTPPRAPFGPGRGGTPLGALSARDDDGADPFDDDPTDGDLALEERAALRRVAGLSTELADVTEVEYRQVRLERVVLVGVWTQGTVDDAERSLAELARLAETAGSVVLEGLIQRRTTPDAATFIGSGKAQELRDVVIATGADTVICDGELTPGQLRQLEEVVKVKVVDRTWLILDIFAQHARSREGKAQVSLAQMQYLLPRLRGWGESLSRQAGGRAGGATGGVGTRGPGETKIETDRRRIRAQMAKLRRELREMEKARSTQRSARRRSGTPAVAIAGYTNAGKSSLLNRLTGAGVLVEDALFATLDPTVRRTRLPSGRAVTVADTVGFVRHLPHQLVEAFRSTLEEVADADLVLHVVDGSDPDPEGQLSAVREVLAQIGAGDVPELVAVNKSDAADPLVVGRLLRREPGAVVVSARTGEGIDDLMRALDVRVPDPDVEIDVLLPYDRGDLVAQVHRDGEVVVETHGPEGTRMRARVSEGLAARLEPFAAASAP